MTQLQQKNKSPQGTSGAENRKSVLFPYAYLLYWISFLPYLCILSFSAFGLPFSFMNHSEILYGADTIVIGCALLCTIPVLPAAVIYEAVFWLCFHRSLTARQKKISLCVVLGIVLALAGSIAFHKIRENLNLDSVYRRDSKVIAAYLQEEFGEALAADMEIQKPFMIYVLDGMQQYHVKSPVLGDGYFVVWVDQETKRAERHNFYKAYNEETGLADRLAEKLAKDMGLPEDTVLHVMIDGFDPLTLLLPDSDALLDSCEYTLDNITFRMDRYDKEKALSLVEDFYRSCGQSLMPHAQSDFRDGRPSFHFFVEVDDTQYVSIYARVSEDDDKTLLLFLCGADEESAKSIPREEMTLSIE